MRKILSVLLVAVMCCGLLAGCGGSEKEETEPAENTEKNIEDKEKKLEVPEMKFGEPFEVKTESGKYIVTIKEWRVEKELSFDDVPEDKMVCVLVYEAENIDFGKENQEIDGLYLDFNAFRISDNNKYLVDNYGLIPPDLQHPEVIPPGYKQEAGISYLVDKEATSVEIVLNRDTGDVATLVTSIE